jgi:hypothetical protein
VVAREGGHRPGAQGPRDGGGRPQRAQRGAARAAARRVPLSPRQPTGPRARRLYVHPHAVRITTFKHTHAQGRPGSLLPLPQAPRPAGWPRGDSRAQTDAQEPRRRQGAGRSGALEPHGAAGRGAPRAAPTRAARAARRRAPAAARRRGRGGAARQAAARRRRGRRRRRRRRRRQCRAAAGAWRARSQVWHPAIHPGRPPRGPAAPRPAAQQRGRRTRRRRRGAARPARGGAGRPRGRGAARGRRGLGGTSAAASARAPRQRAAAKPRRQRRRLLLPVRRQRRRGRRRRLARRRGRQRAGGRPDR